MGWLPDIYDTLSYNNNNPSIKTWCKTQPIYKNNDRAHITLCGCNKQTPSSKSVKQSVFVGQTFFETWEHIQIGNLDWHDGHGLIQSTPQECGNIFTSRSHQSSSIKGVFCMSYSKQGKPWISLHITRQLHNNPVTYPDCLNISHTCLIF